LAWEARLFINGYKRGAGVRQRERGGERGGGGGSETEREGGRERELPSAFKW